MADTSAKIDEFLTFLRSCEQALHIAEAEEQEANDQTQDILHSLELEEHDYRDFALLSKELRQVRRKRRQAKDTIRKVTPITRWVDSSRGTIKSLEQLLGEVRKAEKSTENRIYTPKTKR